MTLFFSPSAYAGDGRKRPASYGISPFQALRAEGGGWPVQAVRRFLCCSVFALGMGLVSAQAQDMGAASNGALSLSLLGGWSSHPGLMLGGAKTNLDDGYNVGARLGYKLDQFGLNNFSFDADYFFNRSGYNHAPGLGASLHSSSFMGDLVYHIPTDSPWSFYGGAGLGDVHDNLVGALHGSSDVLGWQVLGGAEYAFTPSTSLFAEYRYQNAHDANVGGTTGVGNTSNNLSMGVKFTF